MTAVSVVIPAYNVEETVERAISSALAQAVDGDVEIIVVDDASTDGTASVVHELALGDDRVRLLRHQRNAGPGAARATGLAAADGTWLAVLDADDRMRPRRLSRMVEHAIAHDLDVVADNLALIDPAGGMVGLAFPVRETDVIDVDVDRFLANTIPGGRVNLGWMKPVVHQNFLTKHGMTWTSLRHAEDMVFMMDLLLGGARSQLLGWAGYEYTQRFGTISRTPSTVSRTQRDVDEQLRAWRLAAERADGATSERAALRLRHVPDEVRVTSDILRARSALLDGRHWAAVRAVMTTLRHPRAVARCLVARYGPRSRRLRV